MTALRLDNLTKIYPGNVTAVDDLSLQMPSGAVLALLGPSGCGKTTTLRLIAGLETPTAGRIWLDERDVTSAPPAQRGVAMLFQRPALYPHLCIADNLLFARRLLRHERASEAAELHAMAEALGVQDLLQRYPAELSGGQQQRVALGRALLARRTLLLLDEPLRDLDRPLREEMLALLRRLQRQQRFTMLYVTHDAAEAVALTDRIAVLEHGRLLQLGSVTHLRESPATRFVAQALLWPPLNMLVGEALWEESTLFFQTSLLKFPLRLATIEIESGAQLTVGVRAQDIILDGSATTAGPSPPLQATVLRVWTAQGHTLATVDCQGAEWTMAPPGLRHIEAGASVQLRLLLDNLLVFDGHTGVRLGGG